MFGSCSPSSICSFVLGSIERVLDNRLFNKLTHFLQILLFLYSIINNISSISVNMFWILTFLELWFYFAVTYKQEMKLLLNCFCISFFFFFFFFFLALPESLVFPRASTALITAPKRMLSSPLVCPICEAPSTEARALVSRYF